MAVYMLAVSKVVKAYKKLASSLKHFIISSFLLQ
jgi:hypothetical protein